MFLARFAADVQIVTRRESLRDTMSQYLIDQIARTPNIRLTPRTELRQIMGESHVEAAALGAMDTGETRREPVDELVRMITAEHEQIARLLDGLPADRWERAGRHPERGPMSVASLAGQIGAHTVEHAGQIRDIAHAR